MLPLCKNLALECGFKVQKVQKTLTLELSTHLFVCPVAAILSWMLSLDSLFKLN